MLSWLGMLADDDMLVFLFYASIAVRNLRLLIRTVKDWAVSLRTSS